MKTLPTLIVISFVVAKCLASPNGAPPAACDHMTPGHGVEAQDTISPYHLSVSERNVKGGETITVDIFSTVAGERFKGFLLQARTEGDDYEIIGEFLENEDEATPFSFRNCSTGLRNAVTHSENSLKDRISLIWRAPENFEGPVRFRATVVKDKNTFWLSHSTDRIAITLPDINIYTECGIKKSCMGLPDGCIGTKSCVSFGAVIVKGATYEFEMQTSILDKAGWIALALSEDEKMGQDSAIECVNENDRSVGVYTSMTRAVPNNYGARRSDINQNIIKLLESRIEDGTIYCRVERDSVTNVDGISFNLVTTPYHLLMASGSTAVELSIGYHNINRAASKFLIRFREDNPLIIEVRNLQPSRTYVLLHGSLMIVSWIFATSIGVFAARFMKKLWSGKKACGVEIWFLIHRTSMAFVWCLTIAAVIIIWIDVGEWKTSTHSVLGIIATSLCFIQPFPTFFRPSPDDDARPIFNFMHGLVGKLAHVFAVITIFFSTSMSRAELPLWTKYVLISYVVVYLIFYVALTNLGIVSDIKYKQLSDSLREDKRNEVPLLTQRRTLFLLFSLFILGIAVTLINALVL